MHARDNNLVEVLGNQIATTEANKSLKSDQSGLTLYFGVSLVAQIRLLSVQILQ